MTENVRVVNQPHVHAWSRTGTQQWEYEEYNYYHSEPSFMEPEDPNNVFNKYGEDGWELVSVTETNRKERKGHVWIAWFKRPLDPYRHYREDTESTPKGIPTYKDEPELSKDERAEKRLLFKEWEEEEEKKLADLIFIFFHNDDEATSQFF